MATGALDANGIWQYGEDDSEPTFSGLLNKLGDSTSDAIGLLKGAGRIRQTVSATRTAPVSTASLSYQDVTGVTVTITPRDAASKFLILCTGQASNSDNNQAVALQLARNGTGIYLGTTGTYNFSAQVFTGNRFISSAFSINFLDAPATTSAVTYKLQFAVDSAATAYIGRRGIDQYYAVPTSITVFEVVS